MTGSLQVKKNRKNYFAVLNVYDENGKRKLKWVDTGVPVLGNTKRAAQKELVRLLSEYGNNDISITRDVLFIDFFEGWLETLKHSIASTTYDGYVIIKNLHIIPYFKGKRLKVTGITPAVIQKYVSDKMKAGLSPNTVRKHLANLSKCLDSAMKQNIIAYNPVKRIEVPKKERYTGAMHYNERQIEELLEASKDDPLEIIILLAVFYGLRRSEVLGLRWDAVDFETGTLAIQHTVTRIGKVIHKNDDTKNSTSYTTFPMSEKIISELKRWREWQSEMKALQPSDYEDNGYICTWTDGRLLSPCYVSKHFKLLLKKNGLPHIRFHDLRHSSASYLKHLGFDLKDIQVWLRHQSIVTTMNLYTHLDMDAKSNIANSLNEKFRSLEAKC